MSTTSGSFGDTVRDTVKDARDAVRESAEAVSAASGDLRADLEALRGDVARLSSQIADILTAKGSAAWTRAKANLDDAMADAGSKGKEGVEAARELGDSVVETIDDSLKKRPYTTLAIALGIGFVLGAIGRR